MTAALQQTVNLSKLSQKAVIATVSCDPLTGEGVNLSQGRVVEPFDIHYSVYGDPSLPVVVVLGGITANRLVLNTPISDQKGNYQYQKGWWNDLAGDEKAIDTQRYCVISLDYISRLTVKNQAKKLKLHSLTPADQAEVLKLLLAKLSIEQPITLVGSSYGGMVGLSFAEKFPNKMKHLVCISASDRSTHTARAIRSIQKGVFELAESSEQKHQALSLARQLSILFYRTDDIFDAQFVDPVIQLPLDKAVGYDQTIYSYLNHQGQKFANKTTISNYSALLDSIDAHSVNAEKIQCECHFVAVPNDRLISYQSMRKLAHKVIGKSQFYRLESIYGHDAFLKEFEQLSELLKKILGDEDESSTSYASG